MVGNRHPTSALTLSVVLVCFDQVSRVSARRRHGKKSHAAVMPDNDVHAGEEENPAEVGEVVDVGEESNDASGKTTNSSVVANVSREVTKAVGLRKRSKRSKRGVKHSRTEAMQERRRQKQLEKQQQPGSPQERPNPLDGKDGVSQGSASDSVVGRTDDDAVPGGGGGGGGVAGGMEALEVLNEHRGSDQDNPKEVETEGATECTETGPCVHCASDELDLEYCKETGRRQEVRCTEPVIGVEEGGGNGIGVGAGGIGVLRSSITYRSCEHSEEDEISGLLHFWLAMVMVGVAACFGMRKRQQRVGSLYDRRVK